PKLGKVGGGVDDIVAVGARLAMRPGDDTKLRILVERAGILAMRAINEIGDCRSGRPVRETHLAQALPIDGGDLLTLTQTGEHALPCRCSHPEGDAAAGAAAIEAEDESRP